MPILDAARATAIPLGVTAASTAAALASLEPAAEAELLDRVEVIAQRREAVRSALIAQGWPVPEAHGNFVWLPTGDDTKAVAERLFDAGPRDPRVPARGHPDLDRRARVCRNPPPDSG